MELQLCKNCEHTAEGNFCSNCGQKKHTVRLNWKYLQEEIKYTFLHINKGLLYTSKELLTRPGAMVKEFIDGKRVQHYKPILFVFVLAGINGLLNHYLGIERFFNKIATNPQNTKIGFKPSDIYDFITNHYALFELGLLPIVSFCSWLAFKKWGYNYVENIIINCYASGLRLLIGLLVFPIQYLLKDYTGLFLLISGILGIISMSSTIWLYIGLYKGRDLGFVILRILLMGIYFFVMYLLAIIAMVAYLIINHKIKA